MKQSKKEIAAALKRIADLLEIADANTFEIMAHRNAARNLDEWDGALEETLTIEQLTSIPGVGKGIANVILELATTGGSSVLQQAEAQVPAALPKLLKIRGLGPKRIRSMWQELEITGPDDLRAAIDSGALNQLRGFGAKTIERIASGLERLNQPYPVRAASPTLERIDTEAPTGRVRAGTSGFSFEEWKGNFYPQDAKSSDLLRLYAEQLPTVEINNTFYRFPTEKVVRQWIEQTPDSFRFSIKAHSRITHKLRLSAETESTICDLVNRCNELGQRWGCILFQLPPNFARDDQRLEFLLGLLPPGGRYAIEFRHESWYDDAIFDKLREHNVAIVCADAVGKSPVRMTTADFAYVRLRSDSYTDDELSQWSDWIATCTEQQQDVWVYLKHDDAGSAPQAILSRWVDRPRDQLAKQLATSRQRSKRKKSG